MNLYATGFNCWRQLQFSPVVDSAEEPDDIASFQKVLTDELVEVHYASLTCTVVLTSAGLQYAGSVDEGIESRLKEELLSSTAAVAGNGVVAMYDGHDTITQHASLHQFTRAVDETAFSGMGNITQLTAFDAGFVALASDGKIWTWGDERYAATLGREAEKPGLVEELEALPSGKIVKIATGGYTVVALTEGHDLYAWGGHPARPLVFETLSNSPSPVDVEDEDILDCSVGETHMIVLTTNNDVYVTGDNTHGQLGLPLESTVKWEKVPLALHNEAIVGIKAGPHSSFIVTRSTCLA
ncbi:regulator of chromosome condensation 1/beta-lactamase-inhibitor protein II [Nemania sp. FL0916]|nr:regulator of chromosome condensation 1/beta-lactamase-inhibitor protein II [Nemania sp. FL0916]